MTRTAEATQPNPMLSDNHRSNAEVWTTVWSHGVNKMLMACRSI